MLKKSVFLLLISTIILFPVFGSSDISLKWKDLNVVIDEYGDDLRISLKSDKEQLTYLKLIWNDKSYSVSAAEFERIKSPQISTLEVKHGAYYKGLISDDEEPYKIIKMSFGKELRFNEYPSVEFHFFKGAYQYQIVTVKTAEATFQDYKKKPGEGYFESGKFEPF